MSELDNEFIKLGGKTFEFRKLKMRELCVVERAVKTNSDFTIDYAIGIIRAALPDHDLCDEILDELCPVYYELDDAATHLMALTGFSRKEANPGEAAPQTAAS